MKSLKFGNFESFNMCSFSISLSLELDFPMFASKTKPFVSDVAVEHNVLAGFLPVNSVSLISAHSFVSGVLGISDFVPSIPISILPFRISLEIFRF